MEGRGIKRRGKLKKCNVYVKGRDNISLAPVSLTHWDNLPPGVHSLQASGFSIGNRITKGGIEAMKRKRINLKAVCSSDNYESSRSAHKAYLEREHQAFVMMMKAGEIRITAEEAPKTEEFHPRAVVALLLGKERTFTWEEYTEHPLAFIGVKIIKNIY